MSLLRNSSIYSLAQLLQKSASLLLLPIFTHYLTPADYGITAIINALIPVLSILFALALRASITRLYFKYRNTQPDRVPRIWGAALKIVFYNTAINIVLLLLIGQWLSDHILNGINFYPYLALGIATAAFQSIFELHQASLQARQQSIKFSFHQVILFLIQTTTSVALVIFFDWGALGVIFGATLGTVVLCLYSLYQFLPEVNLKSRGADFREVLNFSLPLIPHSLATWSSGMINRLFLNGMVSTSAVGIFSVGFVFGSLINVIASSVNQAFQPWLYGIVESGTEKQSDLPGTAISLIRVFTYFALALSLLSPIIIEAMTDERYHSAWTIVTPIAFAYVFNMLYFIGSGVIFMENVKLMPFITITASAIGILLNWYLIGLFGIMGAAYATVATYFTSSFLAAIVGYRLRNLGFQWARLYSTIFFGLGIAMVTHQAHDLMLNILVTVALGILLSVYEKDRLMKVFARLSNSS